MIYESLMSYDIDSISRTWKNKLGVSIGLWCGVLQCVIQINALDFTDCQYVYKVYAIKLVFLAKSTIFTQLKM